jgi:tetratricopeptide (TPR) repeat protein
MTTMKEIDVRCAVCGALTRAAELTSTSSFGPPDLDLRPQGPARWALEFQVQRCDACGYCARSLGKAPVGVRALVDSAVYRDVLERSKLPRLARSLFCSALVNEAAGAPDSAGWRFLEAAWACDDKHARAQSRTCRERAAEMFGRALELGEAEASAAVVHTLIAELWRRAGRFDDALEACAAALAELEGEEFDDHDERSGTAAIVTFVRGLASAGDDRGRNCAEAFAGEE